MRDPDESSARNLHNADRPGAGRGNRRRQGYGGAPKAPAKAEGRRLRPEFSSGDRVRVRGYQWRIVDVRTFPTCALVDLAGLEADNLSARARLLTPFDRPRLLTVWPRLRTVRPARARLGLAALAAAGPLAVTPYASIDVLPYQLEPALALLTGDATRVLIADEVGLGKTIQAGIAIAELRARGRADRVLVLTPAGLREQWIGELAGRFPIDATLVDAAALRRRMATIPRAVNPWRTWPAAVASIDFIKRPDVMTSIADAGWDVLIVDEAHTVASARDRHTAVEHLARLTPYVLLLTATPHNGDERAYASLCGLGQHGVDDGLILFRRTKRLAGLPVDRRVHLLTVALTAAERRMHRALTAYVRRVVDDAQRRGDADAVLAMIVLTKRALSGAAPFERSVDRRLTLLSRTDPPQGVQMALPLAGQADCELDPADDEPDGVLASAGLDDAYAERVWLDRLRTLAAEAARADSKIRVVRTLLRRTREPAIVFTEYRDTLAALETALASYEPVTLHGGVEARQRAEVAEAFRRGGPRVLLATDVASEGLNLHDRCRIVINLELPWTPARVEQRIGRVDRIGQPRRVHAFNLLARGTAETDVLALLVRKLEAMRRSLGDMATPLGAVRDETILRAALDRQPLTSLSSGHVRLTPSTLREPQGRPEQGRGATRSGQAPSTGSGQAARSSRLAASARDEAARIARWRALWRRVAGPRGPDAADLKAGPAKRDITAADIVMQLEASAPWMAIDRRRTILKPGVLALFRARIPLGTDRAFEDVLIPLHAAAPHRVRAIGPRGARALVRALTPALTRRAAREAQKRLRRVLRRAKTWRARLQSREDAIAAAGRTDAEPAQGRLFQRRGLETEIACVRPSTLREPQGRPELRRGATGSGQTAIEGPAADENSVRAERVEARTELLLVLVLAGR